MVDLISMGVIPRRTNPSVVDFYFFLETKYIIIIFLSLEDCRESVWF